MLRLESAEEYKDRIDADIALLEAEAAEHHGKQDQRVRSATGKYISRLRLNPRYVDACRVSRGLAPAHGYFEKEAVQAVHESKDESGHEPSSSSHIDSNEAAKLAREAEQALFEAIPESEREVAVQTLALNEDGLPKDSEDTLIHAWSLRLDRLEDRINESGVTTMKDVDDLQLVAQEVVDYKAILHKKLGKSKKDLKADDDLKHFELRLEKVSEALLAATGSEDQHPSASIKAKARELRSRERNLATRLVRHHEDTVGLCPSEAREISELVVKVADLKAALKAKGLAEHEQDRNEEVMKLLIRLQELRQKEHHDAKHSKRHSKEFTADMEELEQLHADLEALKHTLRDEHGYSQKDIRQDPEISALEERLTFLKKFGGA